MVVTRTLMPGNSSVSMSKGVLGDEVTKLHADDVADLRRDEELASTRDEDLVHEEGEPAQDTDREEGAHGQVSRFSLSARRKAAEFTPFGSRWAITRMA